MLGGDVTLRYGVSSDNSHLPSTFLLQVIEPASKLPWSVIWPPGQEKAQDSQCFPKMWNFQNNQSLCRQHLIQLNRFFFFFFFQNFHVPRLRIVSGIVNQALVTARKLLNPFLSGTAVARARNQLVPVENLWAAAGMRKLHVLWVQLYCLSASFIIPQDKGKPLSQRRGALWRNEFIFFSWPLTGT